MDTGLAIGSFVNILCSGGLLYLGSRLRNESSNLSEVEAAPVLTPSGALKGAKHGDPRFLQNPFNPSEYVMRAFVEGITECQHPIKSKINGKTDLVYGKTYKTEIRSNDSLIEFAQGPQDFKKDLAIRAPLYFSLKDALTRDVCSVRKNLDVETIDSLDLIAEQTKMKELNFFEEILVQLGRVIAVLGIFKRDIFLFRGLSLGWTEHEFGISVGNALTVYGELTYNAVEKTLRFESPLAFVAEKASLVKKLKDTVSSLYMKIILLLIPFTISSVYLIRRAMRTRQFRRWVVGQ